MTIEQREGATWLRLRVQPRAPRTEIVGEHDGALRIRVAAPPVDGEANHELVRFIAKKLRIAPSRVSIVSGEAGRNKRIRIDGVGADTVRDALGL
jgi:uncharacterized protein (TIGR00251 family)